MEYRVFKVWDLDNFRSALASSSGSPEIFAAASSAAFSHIEEYRFSKQRLIGRKKLSTQNICKTNSFKGALFLI
ncbi:MAG: hypothetical protein HKUEN01_12400 [Candidatus Kuenenia stuttgartiensis]|nr:hypothetical protein [Candidatus Brocadia sinica]GJQ48854.1 MAG: hypothetical protein HKUEN01_12400 [Candidatus Kuenenia stuttgartiensis]